MYGFIPIALRTEVKSFHCPLQPPVMLLPPVRPLPHSGVKTDASGMKGPLNINNQLFFLFSFSRMELSRRDMNTTMKLTKHIITMVSNGQCESPGRLENRVARLQLQLQDGDCGL